MQAGVFPPTLNYRHPDPESPWKDRASSSLRSRLIGGAGTACPRRFQVNAFGFGGSNYVVQVEQA